MIEETLLDAMDKMAKAFEHVQSQFGGVRTGRANPGLVEKISVDYYGAAVPLQQLATFQVPEARQLVVKPHDRGAIPAIEKALQAADLGVTPSNDGVIIRLTFPMLCIDKHLRRIVRHRGLDPDGQFTIFSQTVVCRDA